jgi:putative hemolysin
MSTYHNIKAALRSQPASPLSPERQQQLGALTRVNIDDLLNGFGLANLQRGRPLLARLLQRRAQHFARQVVRYDDLVGTDSLAAGGAWAVQHFVDRLEISGREQVPRTGPALFVANHPGLCDTTALFAAINRPDLRIVAASRPFLHALPNTSRHLLYVDDTPQSRLQTVRAVARHLRAGGAVLTFPGGQIEPDPAVLPGAVEALDRWSSSIEVFARFANDVAIVPTIVSGVLSPRALRHPLTYLRRQPSDRQWLAGLLQTQFRALQHVAVRVAFGHPITSGHVGRTNTTVSDAVKAEARRLIEQVSHQGSVKVRTWVAQ